MKNVLTLINFKLIVSNLFDEIISLTRTTQSLKDECKRGEKEGKKW